MIRALILLIAATLLLSALAAPWVYSALLLIDPTMPWPFSRVYDRIAMVAAAYGLWTLRREFSLEPLQGYFRPRLFQVKATRWASGFLCAFVSSAVLLPLLVSSGKLNWSGQAWSYYAEKFLFKTLPAAVAVSLLEECVFRGIIFGGLRRRFSVAAAAGISSLVYASVHFIGPEKQFIYDHFDPWAGLSYLAKIISRFADPAVYTGVFGLLLVGLVLCYAFHRSRSLFLCIGLHTGWAAGLKMVKHVAVISPTVAVEAELGRRYFLLADPLAWCSIVMVFGAVWYAAEQRGWFREDERE